MSMPMSAGTGIGERGGPPFSAIVQSNEAIRSLLQNRLADQTRQVAVVEADGEVLGERVRLQRRPGQMQEAAWPRSVSEYS